MSILLLISLSIPLWLVNGFQTTHPWTPVIRGTTSSARMFSENGDTLTGDQLRSITVTNTDGERVKLGDSMGDGVSVIVFLRHLGCGWCWSYARAWTQLKEEIEGMEDVTGPVFISIGDPDRLNVFLSKNTEIMPQQIFVDGYDFAAYKNAGFIRMDEQPEEIQTTIKGNPWDLGGMQEWWAFLTTFMGLAPYTEDMPMSEKFNPEGLLWSGGTFVVRGTEIVYRRDELVSGDNPDPRDVLAIAKEAAAGSVQKVS